MHPVSRVLPTAPFTVPLGPGRLRFEPSQPDARGSDATCALAPTCLPRCMSQKQRENLQPRGKKKCLKDPLPRCDLHAGRRGPRGVRCRFPGRLALETEAARSSSAGTKDGKASASGTGSRGERSCTRASSGKVEGGQLAPCERAFVNRLLKRPQRTAVTHHSTWCTLSKCFCTNQWAAVFSSETCRSSWLLWALQV